MSAVIVDSPLESDRFGLRVGRLRYAINEVVDVDQLEVAASPFDVVIMRCPARDVDLPFRLLRLHGWRAITADHLAYWRWSPPRSATVELPEGWTVRTSADTELIEAVLRDAFADYRNHYRANPLFARAAALDGYVEWSRTLVGRSDAGGVLLRNPGGEAVGVALIDWSGAEPDIALAGIRTADQGRGRYPVLIDHVMQLAVERSHTGLTISTQSHNVGVMRSWARLGFEPFDAIATYHLISRRLLGE